MDTKFQSYTFLADSTTDYAGYFIASQILKEKMDVQFITQGDELICTGVTSLII